MLAVGTSAPAFSLLDQDGQEQTNAIQAGKWTIIYFYPKDDTPGCTKEACTLAEVYDEFSKLGVSVVGVSKDSVKSHKKFAEKYKLPFTLLSDPDGTMIEVYGAFGEKSLFGKTYLGILRVSYLINPDGTISAVYPKVDPASHALQLLSDVKELMK